jgi:diaminopimelate epimerase
LSRVVHLLKAHGCSNDVFIVNEDDVVRMGDSERAALARALCRRDGAFGADGVYFVDRRAHPASAQYRNADGSLSELSGNGMRCVGRYVLDAEVTDRTTIQTGRYTFEVNRTPPNQGVERVAVRNLSPLMTSTPAVGLARWSRPDAAFIRAPNPHLVALVDEYDPRLLRLLCEDARQSYGPALNVTLGARLLQENSAYFARTDERGSGTTQSCASAACALVLLLVEHSLAMPGEQLLVRNLGGPISVKVELNGTRYQPTHIGNATYVYSTEADLASVLRGEVASIELDVFIDEVAAYDAVWRKNRARLGLLGLVE